jgi:ParB-like nuclease domain
MPSRANPKTQEYELVSVRAIKTHPRNARQGDIGAIHESITQNGFFGACVVQKSTGHILAGNHRYMAAVEAGLQSVPVIWVDVDDDRALRILLADNKTSDDASYDQTALADILSELANTSDLLGTGFDGDDLDQLIADLGGYQNDGGNAEESQPKAKLADKFGVPPFSVLNAREGWWQDRKKAWLALGIESELGRGGSPAVVPPHPPTVTQNPDGTLNYHGTKGQAKRFNKQKRLT